MAKPKAPRWLTESFAQGIDERELIVFDACSTPCWLAQFDPAGKPSCEGGFERFHFLSRQRVEHGLEALMPRNAAGWSDEAEQRAGLGFPEPRDLILIAAWDPRNGGIACEAHHRRLDSALVPLPSEQLVVPYEALPEHVLEFADDYGLTEQLEAKYEPKGEA